MNAITSTRLSSSNHHTSLPSHDVFSSLVTKYKRSVFAVSYCSVGNKTLSEDVAQEAFVQAWTNWQTLKDPNKFGAWVCGIARNIARNINRGQLSRRKVELNSELPDDSIDARAELIAQERYASVWNALIELDLPYREVLTLYYVEGEKTGAIAELLGVSAEVIHQRLSRGRQHIKASLTKEIENEIRLLGPNSSFDKRVFAALPLSTKTTTATTAVTSAKSASSPLFFSKFVVAALMGLSVCLWFGFQAITSEAASTPAEASTQNIAQNQREQDLVGIQARAPAEHSPMKSSNKIGATPGRFNGRLPPNIETVSNVVGEPNNIAGQLMNYLEAAFNEECPELYEKASWQELPSSLILQFEPSKNYTLFKELALVGSELSKQEQEQYKDCVRGTLVSQQWPKDYEEIRFNFSTEPVAFETEADSDIIESLPAAIGPGATGPAKGASEAEITIVVYTDFRCLYCNKVIATMDELLELYPQKVKIVTKLFPMEPKSRRLAEAAVAAKNQGQFWAMHDYFFSHQDALDISDEDIVAFAQTIGLDSQRFASDWKSAEAAEAVQLQIDQARALGVSATPTSFVNHTLIRGAQPIENFVELIEEELSALLVAQKN